MGPELVLVLAVLLFFVVLPVLVMVLAVLLLVRALRDGRSKSGEA